MIYSNKNSLTKYIIKKILIKAVGLQTLLSLFICMCMIVAFSIVFQFESVKSQYSNPEYSFGSLRGVPQEFIPYYNEVAQIIGIPNWVLAAISKQESNFNPNCGYLGAYGLMQIQKMDWASGQDNWAYYINMGLGQIYKDAGYSFSSSEEMWDIYLKDPRAQIFAGAYELRYYANYVLWKQGKVSSPQYNSIENLKLINFNADESDPDLRETLRRIFACYNGGQGYGMKVDLDNARFDYPNKVYKYAMEYRGNGLDFSDGGYIGDNETIEKAIATGSELVGRSPYVWGGGRNPQDIANRRFDCSSFVHWCYASAGIKLGDYRVVVTDSLARQGRGVSSNEMKRGDIIFFDTYKPNGHVGIYLGNGKFLHDGTSRGVEISELNNPYWSSVFRGNVRRIIES
ncbi:cell wall-binding protein [Paraclostridium sordellii 8483]|nr:cell wall-binding protein [Paeniclostridium sordellii 8483]